MCMLSTTALLSIKHDSQHLHKSQFKKYESVENNNNKQITDCRFKYPLDNLIAVDCWFLRRLVKMRSSE